MTVNFNRNIRVVIQSESQQYTIDDKFRIDFSVSQKRESSSNAASITIYNLSRETMSTLIEEFNDIELYAGYGGDYGLIYKGKIDSYNVSKQGSDVKLLINCSENKLINNANVNVRVEPETTVKEAVQQIFDNVSDQIDVELGSIVDSEDFGFLNVISNQNSVNAIANITYPFSNNIKTAYILSGAFKTVMDNFAINKNSSWSITDQTFEWVHNDKFIRRESIDIVSETTGMIGSPTIKSKAVTVNTLLNNRIKPNDLISIYSDYLLLNLKALDLNVERFQGGLLHRINTLSHQGSNYQGGFTTGITCSPISANAEVVEQPVQKKIIFRDLERLNSIYKR